MLSIYHYYTTKRRLFESNKTIQMLGGENESPPMILAQRDMIQFELEYFKDDIKWCLLKWAITIGFAIGIFQLYTEGYL